MNRPRLILASQSPRRSMLLEQLGIDFLVQPAHIDESRREGEKPADYVTRMACEKARAIYHETGDSDWVLGADTIVLRDDEVVGKPDDAAAARTMLASLADREHAVLSSVALVGPHDYLAVDVHTSQVRFGPIPGEWIDAWSRTPEPLDKAGAYAVQGRTAAFIEHLSGSYSGVMGLPLAQTARLLTDAGFHLPAD